MILKSRKFTTQRNLAVVVAARSKLHVKTHKTPKQTCKKLWNLQKTGTNYMSKHVKSKNEYVKQKKSTQNYICITEKQKVIHVIRYHNTYASVKYGRSAGYGKIQEASDADYKKRRIWKNIVVMKCFYGMINKEILKMRNVGRSHQRCVCTLEEATVCALEEAADTSIAILGGRLWAN